MTAFDMADIYYLANALDRRQLRQALATAEHRGKLAAVCEGTDLAEPADSFPWADLSAACREAMTWRPAVKPQPRPGQQPRIDVEAVKARADIVAVAEGYTKLRKAGRNFVGRCPLHEERTPSFVVYPDKQSWHCFGACNRGGDVLDLIMAAEHVDFKAAAGVLV